MSEVRQCSSNVHSN